jgi:MoaA/NifB/PqqE/SkfB family radical SAM enzyme
VGITGKIKEAVWKNTPEQVKPVFRYLYYGVQIPFKYPENLNKFKFITSTGRKEKISFTPPVFVASICTVCNLKCPTCQYVIKDEAFFKDGGFIKVEDFKAVIDKYGKGADIVFLTGGEALLHPAFDKIAKIIKDKGLSLKLSTNGILIDKWIDTLKTFDFINVSMDSYDFVSFKRLRGGTQNQFDKILEGLSLLKKNNIKFMITFLLSEENLEEIYKMLDFARKYQPSEVGFHNINPHGSNEYTSLTLQSEKVNRIAKDIMSRNDYPFDIYLPVIFDTESEHFKTARCIQPWYYFCFNDKGDIALCCQLGHEQELGNIFKDYDFNSDKMMSSRRQIIKGKYPVEDCLYCHRRFMGEAYGHFDAKLKKWTCISDKGTSHDDKDNNP